MDSTIYFEVLILIDVLLCDIFCNDVVGYVAGTTAKVAPSPQMPPPELLLQVGKLRQKMVRRPAFQPLHQPANRHLWRQRDQQMHVILRYMPLHDRHIVLPADIPDQSRTRVGISPVDAGRRYFVIHTRCRWISKYDVRAPTIFHP